VALRKFRRRMNPKASLDWGTGEVNDEKTDNFSNGVASTEKFRGIFLRVSLKSTYGSSIANSAYRGRIRLTKYKWLLEISLGRNTAEPKSLKIPKNL